MDRLGVLAGDCLLFLAGMVASFFLFRGASWARWFIAVLAVWEILSIATSVETSKSFQVRNCLCAVFAIVTLVLLFLDKNKRIA